MGIVTNRTELMVWGYTLVHVSLNRLTKMAIYLPCGKEIDSQDLTQLFFEHHIFEHCIPRNTVKDHGT